MQRMSPDRPLKKAHQIEAVGEGESDVDGGESMLQDARDHRKNDNRCDEDERDHVKTYRRPPAQREGQIRDTSRIIDTTKEFIARGLLCTIGSNHFQALNSRGQLRIHRTPCDACQSLQIARHRSEAIAYKEHGNGDDRSRYECPWIDDAHEQDRAHNLSYGLGRKPGGHAIDAKKIHPNEF